MISKSPKRKKVVVVEFYFILFLLLWNAILLLFKYFYNLFLKNCFNCKFHNILNNIFIFNNISNV